MTELRFERPSAARASSYASMRDAFVAAGDDQWVGIEVLAHRNVPSYAAMLLGWSEGRDLPEGWGPADVYWILDEEEVVGQCEVRYPLTPFLERIGGHVGYFVHPARRNRGIATFALRRALALLAAKGVREALVTCAESNVASARVIEKCGGRREAATGRRRYRVPTERAERAFRE